MNKNYDKHIESARLLDRHEPALSPSPVMKIRRRIATKRIRYPHIGKCLIALTYMEFQTYKYRAVRLSRLNSLCSIGSILTDYVLLPVIGLIACVRCADTPVCLVRQTRRIQERPSYAAGFFRIRRRTRRRFVGNDEVRDRNRPISAGYRTFTDPCDCRLIASPRRNRG